MKIAEDKAASGLKKLGLDPKNLTVDALAKAYKPGDKIPYAVASGIKGMPVASRVYLRAVNGDLRAKTAIAYIKAEVAIGNEKAKKVLTMMELAQQLQKKGDLTMPKTMPKAAAAKK